MNAYCCKNECYGYANTAQDRQRQEQGMSKLPKTSMASLTEAFRKTLTISERMQTQEGYLKSIIHSNEYVRNCVSNKKKDFNSLSYLIDRDLSQSDCIKVGTGIEKVLKDIILDQNKELEDIKPKNDKGKKERDHLFKDEKRKIIHYAELKSNLYLDTEKCKSTANKCMEIQKELQDLYPSYSIKMYLIGLRYYEKDSMPKVVADKYTAIQDNVLGVNEYLTTLCGFSFGHERDYKAFLNQLADAMFNNS